VSRLTERKYVNLWACTGTQIGDALVKVDGQLVSSTEAATRLILGDFGTPITMTLRRGASTQFNVQILRGTAATLKK
jgi:C-terminal processing protease CtpA/Prc